MVHDSIGTADVAWAGKTARAIRETAATDGSVLVLPIGSIEQHGHHLPVSTDTILADAVAKTGAEAVGEEIPVLVAPPFYPGFSPHHLEFGGTLTLEFATMLSAVHQTVTSALENGFDAVLLLNGHGGNIPLIGAATSTIGHEHSAASIYSLSYFGLAAPFVDEIRDSEPGGMGHGGEFETSLMLHVRPDLVDADAATVSPMDEPQDLALDDMFEGGPLTVYRPFTAYSETGTIGDPTLASAEKGEAFLDGLREELAALLLDVHEEVA